jgi:hypothetical protein
MFLYHRPTIRDTLQMCYCRDGQHPAISNWMLILYTSFSFLYVQYH